MSATKDNQESALPYLLVAFLVGVVVGGVVVYDYCHRHATCVIQTVAHQQEPIVRRPEEDVVVISPTVAAQQQPTVESSSEPAAVIPVYTPAPAPIYEMHTGPRGGEFHYSASGNKVYEKHK